MTVIVTVSVGVRVSAGVRVSVRENECESESAVTGVSACGSEYTWNGQCSTCRAGHVKYTVPLHRTCTCSCTSISSYPCTIEARTQPGGCGVLHQTHIQSNPWLEHLTNVIRRSKPTQPVIFHSLLTPTGRFWYFTLMNPVRLGSCFQGLSKPVEERSLNSGTQLKRSVCGPRLNKVHTSKAGACTGIPRP